MGLCRSQNPKLTITNQMRRLDMIPILKTCTMVRMVSSHGSMLVLELVLELVLGCALVLELGLDSLCVHIKQLQGILGEGFSKPDLFRLENLLVRFNIGGKIGQRMIKKTKSERAVGDNLRIDKTGNSKSNKRDLFVDGLEVV